MVLLYTLEKQMSATHRHCGVRKEDYMKVAKFGGTSLANAFQIKKVCDIVLDDPERKIVVVSAPGKRTKDDIKVTDLLIAVAKARLAGNDYKDELEAVVARYKEIADDLDIEDILPEIRWRASNWWQTH